MHLNEIAQKELKWYAIKGKYPDRVATDSRGHVYLIGDWSWNTTNQDRQEHIEKRMELDGVYRNIDRLMGPK